jgi:hypothetical protein
MLQVAEVHMREGVVSERQTPRHQQGGGERVNAALTVWTIPRRPILETKKKPTKNSAT